MELLSEQLLTKTTKEMSWGSTFIRVIENEEGTQRGFIASDIDCVTKKRRFFYYMSKPETLNTYSEFYNIFLLEDISTTTSTKNPLKELIALVLKDDKKSNEADTATR